MKLKNEQTEAWERVLSYEEEYEVSTLGRVRSLRRKVKPRNASPYLIPERILKQSTDTHGYNQVALSKEGKSRRVLVHRLVAKAFIKGETVIKFQVNHVNGKKKDNRVANLEWVSNQENAVHAVKNKLRTSKSGTDSPSSKLSRFQVLDIKRLSLNGRPIREIATRYNVNKQTITKILRGISYKNVT